MKTFLLIMTALATSLHSAGGADLEKLASKPAVIEATEMKEIPLEISDIKKGWIAIPRNLKRYNPTIHRPDRDQLGVTEFRVIKDGYVLLACHFDYQGNSGGDWQKEALDQDALKELGWKRIRMSKMSGALVQSDNRVQSFFFKKVRKGEHYKLRCNKYDPPYPILLHRSEVARSD